MSPPTDAVSVAETFGAHLAAVAFGRADDPGHRHGRMSAEVIDASRAESEKAAKAVTAGSIRAPVGLEFRSNRACRRHPGR